MRKIENIERPRLIKLSVAMIGLALMATGCGKSEVNPIASSTAPAVGNSKSTVGTGTAPASTSSASSAVAAVGTAIDQQDAARRKEEFNQEMLRMEKDQAFKASEAAKDRDQQRTQMMASTIPVLAMTSLFTQLSDNITKSSDPTGLCERKRSTYKSLLADSRSIFEKAEPLPSINKTVKEDAADPGTGTSPETKTEKPAGKNS